MHPRIFTLLLQILTLPGRLLVVIDDSPTKRYGPKVEGADIHHNPTPTNAARRCLPADQTYLYGHRPPLHGGARGTLSLALRYPKWGALALPLRAALYVRRKTIPTIPKGRGWRFATKLVLAALATKPANYRELLASPGVQARSSVLAQSDDAWIQEAAAAWLDTVEDSGE